MRWRVVGGTLLLGAVCACGETSSDTGKTPTRTPTPDSGRLDGAYPPEERNISLVLWPFYDVEDVLTVSDAMPIPLEGVEVCLKSARPHMGTWDDFRDTDKPCTTSSGTEPIELEGLPTDSELLVTATKEGYWPSVIAAVTSQWSTDVTRSAQPGFDNLLIAKSSSWPGIGQALNEDSGMVTVAAVGSVALKVAWLGGITVSLEPGPSEGPFHNDGTTFVLDANRTLSGAPDGPPQPFTLFAGVAEGEQVLRLEHPSAGCESWGWFDGDMVHGYPAGRGQIRVPVLAGHFTPQLLALCQCVDQTRPDLDPTTCEVAPSTDAGVPP